MRTAASDGRKGVIARFARAGRFWTALPGFVLISLAASPVPAREEILTSLTPPLVLAHEEVLQSLGIPRVPTQQDVRISLTPPLVTAQEEALPSFVTPLVAAQLAPLPPQSEVPSRPFQFRSFVTVEGVYDDNFDLSERNKRSNFREILTPGLSVRGSSGLSFLEASYAPSVVHDSVEEGDVRVFHLFDTKGSLALSPRLDLNAHNHFVRTDEPAVVDIRRVRRGRVSVLQNTFSSNLTYRQETWTLVPRYDVTLSRESQAEGIPGERSLVQTFGADGKLDILARNTLAAGYEFTVGEFKIGQDFTGSLGRLALSRQLDPLDTVLLEGSVTHRDIQGESDFNIYRGNIGFRRDVSPRYTVEARVGYGITDIRDSENLVEYQLKSAYTGRLVRVAFTSGQSLQETFLERENVGVTRTRESTVDVSYEPIDRLTLSLRGRVAENRFLQSTPFTTEVGGRKRTDLVIEGGPELVFRLTRLFSLTVGYLYTNVDSNLRGFGYQDNRAHAGLTATYE